MKNETNSFPWQWVMEFGFGVLKLSPAQFWSLSVHELNAAVKSHYPAVNGQLERTVFQNLMTKHPDQPTKGEL